MRKKMTEEQFKAFTTNYMLAIDSPNLTPTQKLITLHRMYEKFHYGVTTRDLARGYEEQTQWDDSAKKWVTLHNRVRGSFLSGGQGNDNPTNDPVIAFERTEYVKKDGRREPSVRTFRDGNYDGEIRFAPETTARDMGDGSSLLETSVDSLYGSATGIITPVFVDRMMRLTAEKVMAKNFCQVVPMDAMQFYFPLRTSRVTDATIAKTLVPTMEGRSGTDLNVKYAKWEANGWKFLLHAEYTDEIAEMVAKFINVTGDLKEDLALGHALLWDYSVFEGMYAMLVRGYWRRPDVGGADWSADETEIPFGKASVLTTNARKNYLFQDSTTGEIYMPSVVTTEELEYDNAVLLPGTSTSDLMTEGIAETCHLLKMKKSKAEFVLLPKKLARILFKDARFGNQTILTGTLAFESESGYLGKINLPNTTHVVDVWEYDQDELFAQQTLDDAVAAKADVIFCGAYGRFWNMGVFSPFYLRLDEGYEAKASGVGGTTVLRANETKVFTSGSKGSSFPGDYHHLAMLLWVDRTT